MTMLASALKISLDADKEIGNDNQEGSEVVKKEKAVFATT